MDYIEKYRSFKQFMALCLSPYGNEIMKEFPWLIKDFEKIQKFIETTLVDNKQSSNLEIIEDKNKLEEFNSLLKLIPSESQEIIMEINKNVFELRKQLANKLAYDPETYYETYFLQLGVTQKDNESYSDLNTNSTDSIAFQNWFSNSKVVDKDGKPLLVFHGSKNGDFTRFKFDVFPGIYFAENKDYSDWFVNLSKDGAMFRCYLKVENPLDLRLFKTEKIKYDEFVMYCNLKYGLQLPENKMLRAQSDVEGGIWAWRYLRSGVDWLKMIIKNKKFDGITFYENNPSDKTKSGEDKVTPAWMIFNPNQIKSSYSNILFSSESKDIRFKLGGEL
jgi:hypothetical protein